VGGLYLKRDGKTNVLALESNVSVHERYSTVTVYGQSFGNELEVGKNALMGIAEDTGMNWHRPKIVVDHEADNHAVCTDRARKLLADSRISGFTLNAKVSGMRAPNGALWTPGQRISVESEPHGINGTYFLMARKFVGGRGQGIVTELMLKEDGVWTLDAHPHKRKHRRGKNDMPGEIVNKN
jgi:prophage tail gpP-like protein